MTTPAKTNYHTHTTWCDGADTARAMVEGALEKGFAELGFSSHAMFPGDEIPWELTAGKIGGYFAEIRALAREFEGRLRILCGVEAEFIPGAATPDRSAYETWKPDYIIGSVHFVTAPDGARVPVDDTPEGFFDGLRDHFGGSAEAFAREYFRLERQMAGECDFDIVGHPDLIRKYNEKMPWFDENAPWYLEEIEKTAAALAASGKIVEINTGAISRGWMGDAYPSERFRAALRGCGARFVLSSDAHAAAALDCAFDRFQTCEKFVRFRPV
ncbi:MAG: histidinol-phosphatase [Kiritimatiellae bacterium]|nr:histidinol-phosphatase [Kiritimatiellia bacterium]